MSEHCESHGYVLYIDEAGDDVIKDSLTGGASRWLVMGGYLVKRKVDQTLPGLLRSVRSDISATQGRSLHYRDLSPRKRLRTTELLGQNPARAVAICSCKETMVGHRNSRAEAAASNKQFFYNWMIRLVLERASQIVLDDCNASNQPLSPMKVFFAAKGGHHWGRMKAYFVQLRFQAIGGSTMLKKRQIHPDIVNPAHFAVFPHFALAGLQLADVVASAFFEALEPGVNGRSMEPALRLAPIVASEKISPDGRRVRADFGVTLMPCPPRAPVSDLERGFFEKYGYIFDDPEAFR